MLNPFTSRPARRAVPLAACLTWIAAASAGDAPAPREDATLYRRIQIPAPLLTTDADGHTFGGDLRIGDLDGDGRCDLLVYRCTHGPAGGPHAGGMKSCFLGAFDLDGNVLWAAGGGGTQPARPMSVAVGDVLGDEAAEVVCFWHRPTPETKADWRSLADVAVQVRDGRTGRVLREAAPDAVTERRLENPRDAANWVHQRLLLADFRGAGRPRDVVAKLGDTYVALEENLDVLWTYRTAWTEYSRCPAYIPAVGDLDGDGRDELNGGLFVLDHDGAPLWERRLGRHMDSVAVAAWDGGRPRAVCSGFGHVVAADGQVILSLGEETVPHGQEVRVADFRGDLPGPELVLRHRGHEPDVLVVSSAANAVVDRLTLNASPNDVGLTPVYWNGRDRPALLFNGGWLWNLETREGFPLPGLPPPGGRARHRMGFYHAIPADLCGDGREELVVWDPTAAAVFIYAPGPADGAAGEAAYGGFAAGPRQWNPRIMD